MMQIADKYAPQQIESKWYDYWMEHRLFHSEPDEREPYTIVIPPPNVTGMLHMGHMLNNTLQDVLIRRARMSGKNACWVPGMDHASIATEAKVVAMLHEKGIEKSSLTREEFLEYAWEWKEKYGGMIMSPWFDRPLSIAGRLVVEEDGRLVSKLVNIDRDLVMIPNLAIHMNRQVNDGYKYNAQKDTLPIFGSLEAKGSFMTLMAEAAGVKAEDILGHDLFLYSRDKGTIWGADEAYLSCGRLDDLQCAFSSIKGLLAGGHPSCVSVAAVFDNEEVGSGTKQGADSTFLEDTLRRINRSLGRSEDQYLMALASSFMVSADNAHAVHPNYGEFADPTNRPAMNEGIVIKYNANQKYTTDAVSAAIFRAICKKAGVPCQTFANRSDMAGGSTLGNISNAHVALNTVDIGLPQLAMHSPYETAGVKDTCYLIQAAKTFFNTCLKAEGKGCYRVDQE